MIIPYDVNGKDAGMVGHLGHRILYFCFDAQVL